MANGTERCEEGCAFVWDVIDPNEIGNRIRNGAADIAHLIAVGSATDVRLSQEVWSPLEYAGHVRDVLFNLRDRLVVALNEDNPLCKALFGTPRIELGLYRGDSSALVAQELQTAASLFARTWERIPEDLRSRTMVYGYPRLADRSLTWVAAQALHEVEHHLEDVKAGLGAS
jgi:hypothetical protein